MKTTPETAYAELQSASNFSLLEGASHPEELVLQAARLGLSALAVADTNSVSGLVRAHTAAKDAGLRLVIATRLVLAEGLSVLCYPKDRAAYGRMIRLLTLGKRRAPKGACDLTLDDLLLVEGPFAAGQDQILIVSPPPAPDGTFADQLRDLKQRCQADVYLAAHVRYDGLDGRRLAHLADLAETFSTPLVATGDVQMHVPSRKPLLDVLTCIREGCTLDQAGYRLQANAERHLKSPREMARLFNTYPDALRRTADIAEACRFSLDELAYDYPIEAAPDGLTAQEYLEQLTWEGARERYPRASYPRGIPEKAKHQAAHELKLISALGFAPYFLTVRDLVRFARSRDILCQGRGSAANSAVCYCLGITALDPARMNLLFERFVSAERGEPPDIDVDFENARREEVIQYVYEKYGRDRAAMTGTVITYRAKGAIRDVGKVFGLKEDTILSLQGAAWRTAFDDIDADRLRDHGLDPENALILAVLDLVRELKGFPRHLSQHSGGMVMTQGPLDTIVPVANAAMEGRTVIEWDKNDLDALGILKIDILGLGMLSAVHKTFDLIRGFHGRDLDMTTVPVEDPAVYDMLCKADSIGVFQVESRAQMSMLPRLKPREFYDLVVQVAIVRPGPIQGDMVHPYLRRRDGLEPITFPSKELEDVLGRTMGVPLFQEQAMRIAIVAAEFTPAEADGLRRAIASFRNMGQIQAFQEKFVSGMTRRGYDADFARRCFKQIEGFADYGFPESHAASFALVVYVSAWLKRHYPAAFTCALLNSQPMGFYAPAQLIRDARVHGVEVRGTDINHSFWDCTLEPGEAGNAALRLGFRVITGLKEDDMACLTQVRGNGFGDLPLLKDRTGLKKSVLDRLARADAFASLGLTRRQALWTVKGLKDEAPLPLFEQAEPLVEPVVALPHMSLGEEVADDYRATRLSLKAHPAAVLRPRLFALGYQPCGTLLDSKDGHKIRVAGLVTARQRPGTAKGVTFVTLEDESGYANLVVWLQVFERYRRIVLGTRFLGVSGEVQREGGVIHLVVKAAQDLNGLLAALDAPAEEPLEGPDRALSRSLAQHTADEAQGADPTPEALAPHAPIPHAPIPHAPPDIQGSAPSPGKQQGQQDKIPRHLFPSRDFH